MREKLKEALYYLWYCLTTTLIFCLVANIVIGVVYLMTHYPLHVAVVTFLCVIFGLYLDRLYILSRKWR